MKEQNHVQDHMDDPWMESPELLEQACCSYPPETLSYLRPAIQKMEGHSLN